MLHSEKILDYYYQWQDSDTFFSFKYVHFILYTSHKIIRKPIPVISDL